MHIRTVINNISKKEYERERERERNRQRSAVNNPAKRIPAHLLIGHHTHTPNFNLLISYKHI